MLTTLAVLSSSLTGYVERDVYEGLLALTGVGSPLERGETFRATYHLTFGTAVLIDGTVIDVVYFGLPFWIAFNVFLLSPENDCSSGCRELNFT